MASEVIVTDDPAQFSYDHISQAPLRHMQIATLISHQIPEKAIATHLRCSLRTVTRCREHPPVQDRIKQLNEMNQKMMIFGFDTFLAGVNAAVMVIVKIALSNTASDSVKLKAAMWLVEHDPTGLYSKRDGLQVGDQTKRVYDQEEQTRLLERKEQYDVPLPRFDTLMEREVEDASERTEETEDTEAAEQPVEVSFD